MIHWQFEALQDEAATILPDGCVDVIVERPAGAAPRLRVTTLDIAPRKVRIEAGTGFEGIRLAPGVRLDPRALGDCWHPEGQIAASLLAEAAILRDPETEALVAVLAGGAGLSSAARIAGVSPRSVQRRFAAQGLLPPEFWRLLGRVRRAAVALDGPEPLAAIACDHGFSDQAHMTRAFRRWLGLSPAGLRRDEPRLALVRQPGLGTWTGEHSSTR